MHITKHGITLKGLHISFTMVGLCLILVVAAYLRFVNFPFKYGFDIDPTRDSLITAAGAKHLWFPLVGPKSGIGPFSFGPWYYYELILFKLLVPSMWSPWIFVGISSLLFVIVMFFIGKSLEGEKFGLLLAGIAALSPEQIGPTTGLSNPNLVPLHAALTILFFILYMKAKRIRPFWIVIWGLILGIGINHHYQMLLLTPLPFLAFLYKRNKQAFVDALLLIIGISLSFLPLLIYNIEHHWITVTGFLFFITKGRQATYIPDRWLFYARDFWWQFISMLFGVNKLASAGLILLTVTSFVWVSIKRKLSPIYGLLLLMFALDFVFLRYFIVQRELYYFLFLHPFLFIFFGFALWQLSKVKFGTIVAALIVIAMLPSILHQDALRVNPRGDQETFHREALTLENEFPNKAISLYGCGTSNLNRPQGVAFFLNADNKLSDTGTPVALLDSNCTQNIFAEHNITFISIPHTNAVILKDNAKLTGLMWRPISPVTVYKNTVEQ